MVTVSPVGEKIIYPVCARFVFVFPPSGVVLVLVVMVLVVIIVVVKSRTEREALHAVLLEMRLLLLMEMSRVVLVVVIVEVVLVDVVEFAEAETQAVFVGLVSPYGGRGIRVGAVRARVRGRPGALLSGSHLACLQRSRGADVVIINNR